LRKPSRGCEGGHHPTPPRSPLLLACDFVGANPILHLVGDYLYIRRTRLRCAEQVVEQARAKGCSVSAVQATRESMLPFHGTVGGRRVARCDDLYEIENVLEKPTPSQAEQELLVPGLRAGHYLCLFGIHAFTPTLIEILATHAVREKGDAPLQLSPALAELARRERYLALEVRGVRYNIGLRYGLLVAQLALALDGTDRANVLAQLVELLAVHGRSEA
jgi:UTP--glucose-1-phosphate uridylyltransferase